MNKPGRNDPCPCGSGKKYKKCCLARDEAARPQVAPENREEPWIAELRPELDEAIDELLERLEQGAGRAVESEIKALLAKHPRYHNAQFAMGAYLVMIEKDDAGSIPFFERAVEIFPPFPEAHYNLGLSARKICDLAKAVAAFRAAERFSSIDDGIAELARNEIQLIERIVLKGTTFATIDEYLASGTLFNEAFACLTRRDYEQAILLFKRVLSEFPGHVQSFGNMALAYAGVGRKADALACLAKALALDPSYEPARSNRRLIAQMREGEPLQPEGIQEVNFYTDRLKREK